MTQICPICGKSNIYILPKKNICIKCYEPTMDIKKSIDIYICPTCNKYLHGEWKKFDENKFKEFLKNKIKLKGGYIENYDLEKGLISVSLIEDGFKFEKEIKIKINLNKIQCLQCSRKSSGYYEAIIQLRGNNVEKIERKLQKIISELEKTTFVSKLYKIKNNKGFDIYVENKDKVFEVLHKLELKFKTSKKIAGKIDGKDVFRFTYLVRLD
ncbi:MAG: NMD3-related protein [Candidatus Anstonellales archaeon]